MASLTVGRTAFRGALAPWTFHCSDEYPGGPETRLFVEWSRLEVDVAEHGLLVQWVADGGGPSHLVPLYGPLPAELQRWIHRKWRHELQGACLDDARERRPTLEMR